MKNLMMVGRILNNGELEKFRMVDVLTKEVLDLAATKVKEATKKKTQAIVAFNKEFGPYVTSITGVKAADEFNRTINAINELFNKFILF